MTPQLDDDTKEQQRTAIRELIENGETLVTDVPAVSTTALAAKLTCGPSWIRKRLNADPDVEHVSAYDPEQREAVFGWRLTDTDT